MGSVLQNTQLNKVFLIYGHLDDMFISHNLQKDNFRFFLNSHLKNLGYEQVVFYSGAKNVGKFVLDDESAILAINKNKGRKLDNNSDNASKPQPEKKKRILNPSAKKKAPQEEKAPENVNKTDTKPDESSQPKLVYSQPKITPVEFLEDAKKIMADNSHKSAIVFTFFQDFFTDSSAPLQPYYELVSYLWDEYHSMHNENICIFLAPQMTNCDLNKMFDRLEHGSVLKNRFFNENGTANRGSTVEIGLPGLDEIGYMLEYLRIVGEDGRRITFKQKDKKRLCSVIMYLSREAETDEHKSGYLHAIYKLIVRYMKNEGTLKVELTEDIIKQLYSKYRKVVNSDPLEKLRNTKGWESVAKRVDEILKDYRMKKKQAESAQSFKNNKSYKIKTNERLENNDNDSGYRYPVPHFILKGNPGVGKTTIARLVGQIFYNEGILESGHTVETNRAGLVDQYVGGTAIKTTETVRKAVEGVLFIDDAYSLIEKGDSNNYPKEAIDTLVPILTNSEEYRFCLIMAGYPDKMEELLEMNSGLKSRFSKANILTIEDYKPELLKNIFINECHKDGFKFAENPALDLDLFFENLYNQRNRADFGNARDIVALANEVKLQCGLRDDLNKIIIKEDFGESQSYFIKRGVSSIDEIYGMIDKYVGMDFVKKLFQKVQLEVLDTRDCIERGIKPEEYADHFIFAGNPGTGKTTVGKMLGAFYSMLGVLGGAETLFVDASDLIGTHVGESKEKTIEIMQKAINHNQLLFIDEAYQISESAYGNEIIGAMMSRMTENAKDFKIVFAMYSDKVEDFMKMNSGLSRRLRIVDFPDYTPPQLLEIFDRTIAGRGCTITEEARERVKLVLTHLYNVRTAHFGNAGEVIKLVREMKEHRLLRTFTGAGKDVDKYQYVLSDIPKEMLDMVDNMVNPKSLENIMQELDEQIGMSDLKNVIISKQEEIMYAKRSGESLDDVKPGYYFFVGNPGTGKSTSAKLFADCLNQLGVVKTNNFHSCTAKDLIGEYVGHTQQKAAALLQKSINGVLFIDEAYSLSYADRNTGGNDFKKEAVEELIAFMDIPEHRKSCCIILAGYENDMQGLYKSNSGMRSRIEEVHFKDYSAEECYEIFELFCNKNGFKLAEGIRETYIPVFERLKESEYFSNGRTARTIYEKTTAKLKRRIARARTIDEVNIKQILLEDLLSVDEAIRIVGVDGK